MPLPLSLGCLVLVLCAALLLAVRHRRDALGFWSLLFPGRAGASDDPGAHPLALTPGPEPVLIAEKFRFQHLEIVGSSGTGKNYHGLLPMIAQDIQGGAGLIIVDPKGSMRRRVTAYAHEHGRARDLRCLDLADPRHSDGYNPFVGDDPSLVAERAHAALYAEDATPTPFYRDTALAFFHGFFGLCRRLDVLPTPAQLRHVALDQQALASLIALAPRSPEARDLRRSLLRRSPLDYAAQLQGVVNALTPLTQGAFAGLLNTSNPGIELGAVLDQGGILYAGLASDQYPSVFKRVSTLLLMDLQASLTRRYNQPKAPAVFVYLDEFADLLYPQVRALIAKAREARVGLIVAHQSLDDLARRGAATAAGIFENTSNKILLRQGGADAALTLARLSGTRPGEQVSQALNRQGLRGPRTPGSASPTRNQEHRFDPNALLDLAVGEAFMIVQHSQGRALHRGRLLTAPAPKPFRVRKSRARAKNAAHQPLVLAPSKTADIPRPKPNSPLAQTALELLDRSDPE